jgi:predicted Mrr-cat superfamily restriction endonuclease
VVQQTVWGVHAGEASEADALFRRGRLAVGSATNRVGDLRQFTTREQLAGRLRAVYSADEIPPGAVPTRVTGLLRIAQEMRKGDLVVYSPKIKSSRGRQVWLGEISCDYEYRPDLSREYPYQRAVHWHKTISRDDLSPGAQQELGQRPAVFRIKQHAEEFKGLLGVS